MPGIGTKLLFLIFLISSCGKAPGVPANIPKSIKPHYKAFTQIFGIKPRIDFYFTDIKDGDTLGECHYTPIRKILIDRTYWKNYPYHCREMLIFHEMGHCVLDLDHSEEGYMTPEDSCGTKTAYERVKPDWISILFEGYFIEEY